MAIQKAFKFRIYPTKEQKAELAIQFGHARFVYNAALDLRKRMYFDHGVSYNYYDCANVLAHVKAECEDFEWLSQADSQVLQQSLQDLDKAFSRYFDMCRGKLPKPKPSAKPRKDGMELGYPTFKRKFDKQSIRYPQRFKLEGQRIYLPKVGWVKINRHRKVEGELRKVTVSKTKTGKYFASIQCQVETDIQPTTNAQAVGIDLGLKDFAILSTGEKIAPPQHLRVAERRLRIRQRRLSRKAKGSNSQTKARLVVSATHEKITNRRKDFHHQLSRYVVDQFGSIGLETLNVNGMVQNPNLAKSISDAGWSQFVTFIEYKAAWTGVEVVKHDRWFASSKTCFDCGFVHKDLKQSDRSWVCPACGVIHDRDENAANNLIPKSTAGAAGINAGWDGRKTDMSSAVRHSAPEKSQLVQLVLF